MLYFQGILIKKRIYLCEWESKVYIYQAFILNSKSVIYFDHIILNKIYTKYILKIKICICRVMRFRNEESNLESILEDQR